LNKASTVKVHHYEVWGVHAPATTTRRRRVVQKYTIQNIIDRAVRQWRYRTVHGVE